MYYPTCKQHFMGQVQLRLVIALWVEHASEVEAGGLRLAAMGTYSEPCDAGEYAGVVRLQRGILDTRTRTHRLEHPVTLRCFSNLAASLSRLGECAEAAVLQRTTPAALTRTTGMDNQSRLTTASSLLGMLIDLGECAEAEALGRDMLEKMRLVRGRDHRVTLVTSNLAVSLSRQGKVAGVVQIEREVLISSTRLLGAEREEMLRGDADPGDQPGGLASALRPKDGGRAADPRHAGCESACAHPDSRFRGTTTF